MKKRATERAAMLTAVVLLLLLVIPQKAWCVRIKELSHVEGARENMLTGYGIVVGLDDTGDDTKSYYQSIANMLEHFGIRVPADQIDVGNVAAVMVTAKLPPFAKPGMEIDIDVASVGDADSLAGGTLIMTPLLGPDGKVYAVAQGPLTMGGFNTRGGGGKTQKNHPTAVHVPNGAIVERAVPITFSQKDSIRLFLNSPDFATASRIANAVNLVWPNSAKATDPATVEVLVPPKYRNNPVPFVAQLQELEVAPDIRAKVVLDERTGTVVMGGEVKILPVAISHGNLSISVAPPKGGRQAIGSQKTVFLGDEKSSESNLEVLVNALNRIGATPRDIIAILRALKATGALKADLEVI